MGKEIKAVTNDMHRLLYASKGHSLSPSVYVAFLNFFFHFHSQFCLDIFWGLF